jgi:molybdopterin synthase sulfur carrier subunit
LIETNEAFLMKIQLLYFAALRESFGMAGESLESDARTVDELRAELCSRGDVWAEKFAQGRNVRAALNKAMVDGDASLHDGAEVAFFPPVTGG